MGVCSIGEAVAAITSRRSQRRGAPVWRGSQKAGSFEADYWRQPQTGDFSRVMAGARALERETRAPGRPQGDLGPVALELLAQLYRLGQRFNGRIEPSLDFLMGAIKRSRTAVVRALKQLRDAGFVEWRRRFEPVPREGSGPRIRQTSNAYRLLIPKSLVRLLGKRGERSPIPDDFAQRMSDHQADRERALNSLTPRELAFAVAEGALANSLAALADTLAARDQRELSGHTEPRHLLIQGSLRFGDIGR